MSAPEVTAPAFTPRPGAAPLARMILAQAELETRLLLRNGEQVLLTVVIPTLLLVLFSTVHVVDVGTDPVSYLTPGILALAVLSTAFTGQAIATGFQRRYGVLKRLGAEPLPRAGLLVAKTVSVLVVEIGQVALLVVVGMALGWRPHGSPLSAAVLVLAGTAAFSALALLMAGTLRAQATLAGANLVYLLLMVGGGIAVPLGRFPAAARPWLDALPITALADGLRSVLSHGSGLPWADLGVLAAWTLVAGVTAALTFRWE